MEMKVDIISFDHRVSAMEIMNYGFILHVSGDGKQSNHRSPRREFCFKIMKENSHKIYDFSPLSLSAFDITYRENDRTAEGNASY
jgi:hypothetical protein